MRKLIILLFLITGIAYGQVPPQEFNNIRLTKLTEEQASEKVLVIDATGLIHFKNQTDIEPDLDDYYTKSEVTAILGDYLTEAIINDLFDGVYTKSEADALLNNKQNILTAGNNITISGNNISSKDWSLDDVSNVGNETTVRLTADKLFASYTDNDFVQWGRLKKAGWSLQWLDLEYKLVLRDADDNHISTINLSSLVTGDLVVSIEVIGQDTFIVFTQGGVESGRINANALLTGIARDAMLSGKRIDFKDINNMTVYDVNLAPIFEDYYTITESDGRYSLSSHNHVIADITGLQTELDKKALKSTSISAGTGLTGGGTLSSNRTIALSAGTISDINKGIDAKEFVDELEIGGRNYFSIEDFSSNSIGTGIVRLDINLEPNTQYTASSSIPIENDLPSSWFDIDSKSPNSSPLSGNGISLNEPRTITTDETGIVFIAVRSTYKQDILNGTHKIKLEKGNQATDWTPAPEDVQDNIDSGVQDAKQHADNLIASLELGGRNYIVLSNINSGYLRSDGSRVADSDWNHTDYIDVSDSKKWVVSGYSSLGGNPATVYYDSNKNYLSGQDYRSSSLSNFTVPSVAKYMRFSYINADDGKIKLEKGDVATDWTPSPEDQVTDWNQSNEESFSFIKNKPTDLGDFNNDLGNYGNWVTKAETDGYYSLKSHSHTIGNVTGLQTELDKKALKTTSITAGTGLTGGGTLSSNRTIALSAGTISDIQKGVEADSWGNHFGEYIGIGGNTLETSKPSQSNNSNNFRNTLVWATGENRPTDNYSWILSLDPSIGYGAQIGGRNEDIKFRGINNNVYSDWYSMWHEGNLTKLSDLNNDLSFYTEAQSDNKFALKSHSHSIGNITGLQTALNNKQDNITVGAGIVKSGNKISRSALTGDVTASQDVNNLTISSGAVTSGKLATSVNTDIQKGVTALSGLSNKENNLQSGTSAQIIAGTNTTDKKWSAKEIRDGVIGSKETLVSFIYDDQVIETQIVADFIFERNFNVQEGAVTKLSNNKDFRFDFDGIAEITVTAYFNNELTQGGVAIMSPRLGSKLRLSKIGGGTTSSTNVVTYVNEGDTFYISAYRKDVTPDSPLDIRLSVKKL